jgi:large subunit ribosomal protein L4
MSETLKVDVLGADSKTSAELPAHLFDVQTNIPLIHQVVVAQQAAARQGTHSTKTRGDVSGGGIKPWRQKGTGRARQGSRRAPQWTGGGTVHGPHPRSYAQRTPKKMVAAALRGVLSDRVRDGKLFVLDTIVSGELPSTRAALASLAAIGDYTSAIVVLHRDEDLAWLSLRNVAGVHAIAVDQLNVYDVLVNESVVFTTRALDAFVNGPQSGKAAKAIATSTEAEAVEPAEAEQPAKAEKPAKAAKAEKAPKAEKSAEDEKPAEPKAKKAKKATDEEAAK